MGRQIDVVLWANRPLGQNKPPRICVVDRAGGIYTFSVSQNEWVEESRYVPTHYGNVNFVAPGPYTATTVVGLLPIGSNERFYIERVEAIMEVSTTNDGSNAWALAVRKQNGDPVGQVDTLADSADTQLHKVITTAQLLEQPYSTATSPYLQIIAEKVGSPGDLLYCVLIVSVLDYSSPA